MMHWNRGEVERFRKQYRRGRLLHPVACFRGSSQNRWPKLYGALTILKSN